MKKLFCLLLAAVLMVGCVACGGGGGSKGFEIALITDLGTIDDKSFNQGAWEGVVQYAEENDITHKYYRPTAQGDDEYLAAIDLAIEGGAKIIVTPGFLFEVPIFIAQDKYPNIHFILLDGTPHSADYSEFKVGANTVGINYAEDQAGFLAGYAAVKDGYRKLGFMGGMAVPAVIRFGNGFVQGAEFAAKELGLAKGDIVINYNYTGKFEATPEAQALAAAWYNDGIEVIFGCGGALGNSVMAAATQNGAKVIGVDVDQSGESPTVITSATKGLQPSVYAALKDYYADSFPGGKDLTFDAANAGVGLPMETSKFATFSQADYDAIFARLVSGEIPRILDLDENGSPSIVPVEITVVNEVK